MKNFYKLSIIVFYILCMSACVSLHLQQPLPKNSCIGVISTFNDNAQAEFKHMGTTMFQDDIYHHRLPNLELNSKIATLAYKTLNQYEYKGIIINELPKQKLFDQNVYGNFKFTVYGNFKFTDYGNKFLQELTDKYKIDYLLLIVPGVADISKNEMNDISYIKPYGICYRSFLGIKQIYIAGGYIIYLIDVKNSKVLVKQDGLMKHKISSTMWKDTYDQIDKNELYYIVDVLEKEMPESISKKIIDILKL